NAFAKTFHAEIGGMATEVPKQMFYGGKLETISLGENIFQIGYCAFSNSKIRVLKLPASVRNIGGSAFYSCDSLGTLILNEGLDSIGEHAFALWAGAPGVLKKLTIPASVRKIGGSAFDHRDMDSLTIQDSEQPLIVEAGNASGYNLPKNLLYLYLGRDIEQLSSISGSSSGVIFYTLEDLILGENVTRLYVNNTTSNGMFGNNTKLRTVTAPWTTPFAFEDKMFSSTAYENAALLVVNGTQSTYANTDGWKNFKNIGVYAYNVSAEATAGGTLTLLGKTVTAEQPLAEIVKTGTGFSISAAANEGYELTSLTINGEERKGSISGGTLSGLSVEADMAIKAVFEKKKFAVTAFVAEGGTITINGQTTEEGKAMTVTALWGDSIQVAVAEGDDYLLESVMINDTDVTSLIENGVLAINDIREAKNIVATFKQSVLKHLRITDGRQYTQTESFTTQKLTYKRTFTDTKSWDVLLLPVSLDYTDWKDKLEIAYIYDVNVYDRDNDGKVDYTEIEAIALKEGSSTKPNYPYFVRAKQLGDISIVRGETEVSQPETITLECANTMQTFSFTGSYDGITAQEMTQNGWYAMNNGVWTLSTGEGISLPYMRAYLTINDKLDNYGTSSNAPQIFLKVLDSEDVSAVKSIINSVENIQAASVYDLNGQRLTAPKKGFNIIDGKKVMVK
ncbi:MAG: leucine-rich repeat domain-containing protein, partial [Prevotella sp.]|nr:leucine-rich repeat domain-containing protein [Prevotella sp.]